MGNGNFKVRCVDLLGCNYGNYTVGKVYEVKDGKLTADNGAKLPSTRTVNDFEDWQSFSSSKFELVKEETVIIHRKGRETIATLKDGKTIIKTAKATCNPSDTFNAEFGRELALARLNDDQKIIDWLLRGEVIPFVPSQSRIVKQDKYEIGDKVKIIDKWVPGCRQASSGKMDKWLGKIVTVKKVDSDGDYHIEEDDYWYWNNLCIEGKLIEESVAPGQPVTSPVITPFDWEGFKAGKFAVHCDTEEKAMQFFDELKIQGIKWRSDKELNSHETHWDCYRDKTTFGFMRGGMGYGDLEDFTVNIPYTPNYREVDRPAKVGEWIKIVAPDTLVHTGYSEGDLIHVDELAGENENGIVIKPFHIVQREYVVLEPINHSIELIAHAEQQYIEVKRQAKTGERVKIVKAEQIPTTDGKPDYKNGDVLEISNGGYQARYAAGTGDNGCARVLLPNEYVVLESVPVPAQPKEVIDLTSISDEELITELSRRLNK